MKLKDNSTQEIDTALYQLEQRLKSNIRLTDVENSNASTAEINAVDKKLTEEIKDRQSADEKLQDNINKEIANRQGADAAIENAKQDKLIAGDNIQINGNIISATLTGYTAEAPVKVTDGKISLDTVPVNKGGTGVTTQADINKAFIGNLTVGNDDVTDGTEFVSSYTSDKGFADPSGLNKPYKRQFVKVWNYIKGKISSVLGLTKDNYGGKSATATTAESANKIKPNYTKSLDLSEVTSETTKYIKIADCIWAQAGTLQVYLGSNNSLVDTLVINFGGGNAKTPMLCGYYHGHSNGVYSVIARKGSTWVSDYSIYVKVRQVTTCVVRVALLKGDCTINITESTTAPTNIFEWPVNYGLFGNFTGNVTGNVTGSSGFLANYSSTRLTSGNIVPKDASEWGGMRKDVVTSSMTDSGRPGYDGHLLTMFWDNDGRWDSQFFVSNETPLTVKARTKENVAEYGPWVDLITSNNIGSQTVAKAGNAGIADTARIADAILDYNKGTPIYVRWGGPGIDSAEWYPAFNATGSAIEPIHGNNIHVGTANHAKNMYYQNLDLSSLDKTKFYPVFCLPGDDFAEVAIHSPSLVGSAEYNQNRIHFDISTHGWNDTPFTLNIREYACYQNNEITIGCIGRGTRDGAWAIWLRGGIHYTCFSRNADLNLKTSDYTYGYETYTVGTNYYGGSNSNVEVVFTPQYTITDGSYSTRAITSPVIQANNKMVIPIGEPSSLEDGCIWIEADR